MGRVKKKNDVISERAQALSAEIAALESQIKQLDSQLRQKQAQPRLRSTAVPHGPTLQRGAEAGEPSPAPAAAPEESPKAPAGREPVFEEVDQGRLRSPGEVATPDHYNELGVRKYDLPALIGRIKNHFRGPTTTNPKLVSYLAAGGVQGLRPLRYEKRVARNRFMALVFFLFVVLLGIILAVVHRR